MSRCENLAARCLAALGSTTEALALFRKVLAGLRKTSDGTEEAVEVRMNIGILLITEGATGEALVDLTALRDDLEILSRDSDTLVEVRAVMSQLRASGGGGGSS